MSKRGRKKKLKLNIKPETLKSVFAVVLILIGTISLWSLLAPSYNLTSIFYKYLSIFFGSGKYIFPFTLISTGIIMLWPVNYRFLNLRISIGLYFLFSIVSALSESFSATSGGMLGLFISKQLSANIGYVGNLIVLFLGLFATLIFISDIPIPMIHAFFENLSTKMRKETVSEEEDIIEADFDENKSYSFEESSNLSSKYTVLPSMSEPMEDKIVMAKKVTKSKESNRTIVPSLPYIDKVWDYPALSLLDDPDTTPVDRGDVKKRAQIIEGTLKRFNIEVKVVETNYGPSVTQYALELDASSATQINSVTKLEKDLAMALASPSGSVIIQAPIPGRSLIGIEVPNNSRSKVSLKTLLNSDRMKQSKDKLAIVLGLDVTGTPIIYNIAKMPHLLVAGATGSGKSVFLHSLLFSILYRNSPSECKLIMIDPKRVELTVYESIPHLITPVVTDILKAPAVFKWAVNEMDRRYKLFESAKVRNIDQYNDMSGFQALPNIVIIVDELAELMMAEPAEIEKAIQRLAQLSRAVGIHLILATQRPSTNVITGTIKANIPSRISFNVTSNIDSRVIIDQPGAEKLLGKGDMLFVPPDVSKPTRIQGPNVSDIEITKLTEFLKNQGIEPEYNEEVIKVPSKSASSVADTPEDRDELYEEAKEVVIDAGKASASLLQRRLSVGYARAARILDELEAGGVISPANGSKPREILIQNEEEYKEEEEELEEAGDKPVVPVN
jgi:S-DNA-T family DNA segregation ATPase FtsK/SpoIIIE